MSLFDRFADRIIAAAESGRLTPYFHIAGYMERFWVVGARNMHRNNDNSAFDWGKVGGVVYHWMTDFVAIRLHHILRGDHDRHKHNHPTANVSVVLRGGYWECMPGPDGDVVKWRGPGSIVFRRASSLHKLEMPVETTTWSLFIIFRKTQGWGFLVPWKEYLGE